MKIESSVPKVSKYGYIHTELSEYSKSYDAVTLKLKT